MDKSAWTRLGINTSRLGFGCMRFPMLPNGEIDEPRAEELLDTAYRSGVTYFDTAYIYHNQKSEEFAARCLSKYPRESYTLATKLPPFLAKTLEDAKRIFEDQLNRLKTSHIDFYLLHGIDSESFHHFKDTGILAFCESLQKSGRIRYLGFSFHGAYPDFEEIIKARSWDFCQIQLNYMDTEEQAGLKGYTLAEELGVPLVIMEPVKGGSLSMLPEEIASEFTAAGGDGSLASYALRWVGGYPNNKVILSGMSSMEQLEDNLETFTGMTPLTAEELRAIDRVGGKLRLKVKNGCTGCRYCMPCPFGVDIPENFALWNRYGMYHNKRDVKFAWTVFFDDAEKAKSCTKCGACEEQCPQKLHIRDDLETLQKELDDVVASV